MFETCVALGLHWNLGGLKEIFNSAFCLMVNLILHQVLGDDVSLYHRNFKHLDLQYKPFIFFLILILFIDKLVINIDNVTWPGGLKQKK